MRLIIFFWLLALPARADTCTYRDLIVDTARTILDQQPKLNRIVQRRFGASASYLLIDYGALSEMQADALLSSLEVPGNREVWSMRTAWKIARHGIDPSWTPADLLEILKTGGVSVHRAVLLADDGESYFRALQEADTRYPFPSIRLGQLVFDRPDAVKLRIAQSAEAAGALVQAAQLLAAVSTRDAFDTFVARQDSAGATDRFGNRLIHAVFPITVLSWGTYQPADLYRILVDGQPVLPDGEAAAGLLLGRLSFSSILYNKTGDTVTAMMAAQLWWTRYKAGAFDPVLQPEAAMLEMRDAWLRVIPTVGERRVEIAGHVMPMRNERYDFAGIADFKMLRSERHFAGTLADTLDWMAAKAALKDYLRGNRDQPDQPLLLTDAVDWAEWQDAARMVRDDVFPIGIAALEPKMLAELLWVKGDFRAALAVADLLPATDAMYLRHDLMNRLDRLCAGETRLPQVMTLYSLYDFAT